MITRLLENALKSWLWEDKILILYGARQVGKTTLCQTVQDIYRDKKTFLLHGEKLSTLHTISLKNIDQTYQALKTYDLVIIDEAQNIPDIGKILKLLWDMNLPTQIIATGSSSFEIANKLSEPLTGRAMTFCLTPLSLQELYQTEPLKLPDFQESAMIYGLYPEIILEPDNQRRQQKLDTITGSYLYRDILQFQNLKRSDMLTKLLRLLAFQIGSEVSYHELAQNLGTSSKTVMHYIDLLEKSFVVFRLGSFSKNLRNEIKKSQKIFFYDLGIRNSLIQNFNPLELRNDVGQLWENLCTVERVKWHLNQHQTVNKYFWRTHAQQELDYLEEKDGRLQVFEWKYSAPKSWRVPKKFAAAYPDHEVKIIHQENLIELWE